MAIVNSLEAGYFVLDVPDVRWPVATGYQTVEVEISSDNGRSATFSESYTPDSDGSIVLRGLAGLLAPYTSPCPTPINRNWLTDSGVGIPTLSRVTWTARLYTAAGSAHATVHSSYAYYASQRTNTRPGATAIWLSRYTQRDIAPAQPLLASCMLTPGVSVAVRVTYMDAAGTLHAVTATPTVGGVAETTPSQAAVFHYTLGGITSLARAAADAIVEADAVVMVDFLLMQGGEVKDTLRYRIDRTPRRLLRVVAFTNCFGMLETEAFDASEDSDLTMEADYSYMDDQYEKVAQQLVRSYRLCAGAVDDERRRSIQDIATSPQVFLIRRDAADCFEQMTVTSVEQKDLRPHREFQTAYVTLRPSHRHQEVVSRGPAVGQEQLDGIFDYTFDDSFN